GLGEGTQDEGGQHARLGKFRRVDWTRPHCTQVGSWLWNCLSQMDCFDEDECGYPCFHADHKADLDKLAEEVLFDHPLYKPRLVEPPAWTAWRVECPGDIGVTFVKASDPVSDPIRSLFMFAEGKPLGRLATMIGGRCAGRPIDWLEIAIANAFGVK